MQNPNDLRDEPKDVVRKTQIATALSVLVQANLRNRLIRDGQIKADLKVEDALKLLDPAEVKKLKVGALV